MAKKEWTSDSLTISKQEVPVRLGRLRQADLQFYPENPRVHSIIYSDEEQPSQALIQQRLVAMEHVKQLVQSIKANGGLTDPLLVRDGDYVVLEGNSRLAAYRILTRTEPIRWGMVKVKLLPKDIAEELVFALLGEYHIIGRKDWAPYEQAGYLWRRHTHHEVPAAQMADEMGLSTRYVSSLIKVYSFMVQHGDRDVNRWSYYEELLKSQCVNRAREKYEDFDKTIVRKIKSGEIPRAIDVREKVVKICRAGGKTLTTFLTTKRSLDRCYVRAKSRGVDNEWLRRLKKWREIICDPGVPGDFKSMRDAHQKKCLYELRKIRVRIDALLKKHKG